MKTFQYVVYIEQDENGIYIGSIPSIPSCYAEGDTQEEMLKNLREVATLCLRNTSTEDLSNSHFVGIQNLDLAYA